MAEKIKYFQCNYGLISTPLLAFLAVCKQGKQRNEDGRVVLRRQPMSGRRFLRQTNQLHIGIPQLIARYPGREIAMEVAPVGFLPEIIYGL